MTAGVYNLKLEQGATYRKRFLWTANSVPVDLTGYTARMQLRPEPTSSTILASITSSVSSSGQIIIDPANGIWWIHLTTTVTNSLSGDGTYDVEFIAPNGDVVRVVQGKFTVSPNTTR